MTLMFPMGGLPKPRSGEAATGPIVARRSLLKDVYCLLRFVKGHFIVVTYLEAKKYENIPPLEIPLMWTLRRSTQYSLLTYSDTMMMM